MFHLFNHCHKYLTEEVIESPTQIVRQTAIQSTNNKTSISNAFRISQTAEAVLLQYSKAHSLMAHKRPIPIDDIESIEREIKEYIRLFKESHDQTNLIPKQHLLEFHCIDWIKRFGFGMAFGGEQGGEALHASLNRIKRMARGIKAPGTRLRYIMRESITRCAPELRECDPPVKKRKRMCIDD